MSKKKKNDKRENKKGLCILLVCSNYISIHPVPRWHYAFDFDGANLLDKIFVHLLISVMVFIILYYFMKSGNVFCLYITNKVFFHKYSRFFCGFDFACLYCQ